MTAKACHRLISSFVAEIGCVLVFSALPAPAARGGETISPAVAMDKGSRHWAFQSIRRLEVPRASGMAITRTPIDVFLLSRLEARRLTFSPEAERATLIRRAYLDLWGLPPEPAEVDAFLADRRPDAWERLIDRLLASPRFGERWGRHWLDVVGYADTVGFDVDANNIILSEGKWRYRDYVIDSFNHDKPYDRFVTEQLAGDELVDWRSADHFTTQIRELLIATGYLRTARDLTHEPESNIALNHFGVLHDTAAIVGNSLLGLTFGCAQCHDHKFDSITQRDYYRLMAVFTPAYNPANWKPVFPWKREIRDRGLPDVSPAEQARIERHNEQIDRDVAQLKHRLSEIRRPIEAHLLQTRLQALPEAIRADTRSAIATPAAKRNAVQKYLAEKFESSLRISPEQVSSALSPEQRTAVSKIAEDIATLERSRRSFGKIQALYDVGPPPPTFLLKRGNFKTPGREVEPGFPEVLCDPSRQPHWAGPVAGSTSGRRKALADWVTTRDSRAAALLSRVMVNRIWQHLFGRGIVATPENFGLSGEAPTHPELLEWLSGEFIRGGWRIKPMIRLLMVSTVYRQASAVRGEPEVQQVDPGNHLLWRMPLRRLEAEAIRDSILAVSGRLDGAMGGPPILLHARPDGMVVIDGKVTPPSARNRRSIYLLSRRAYNLSLLTVFDQPLVAINCPSRDTSAVPLQSLMMKNDAFIAEHARHLAQRVASMAAGEQAARIAFRLTLVRMPSTAELAICTRLLAQQSATYGQAGHPAAEADLLALVELCHTLLNTSEFLYVE
jgi:hypothetical protein